MSRQSTEAAQKLDQYEYGKTYETPEGAQGRTIGQTQALRNMFSGTSDDAMRATGQLADDAALQGAVAGNISDEAAQALQRSAQLQSEGLRRLASLRPNLKDKIPEEDVAAVGNALLAMNPASFPITRLAAVGRLFGRLKLTRAASQRLMGNLFSQDSRQISAALRMLNNAGRDGRRSIAEMAGALSAAGDVGPRSTAYEDGSTLPAPTGEEAVSEVNPFDEFDQEDQPAEDLPYGHKVISSLFPDAEITDDVRDPNSDLGRANPNSYHVQSDEAVDLRPIPGMTFDDFVSQIKDAGYEILEAIDETKPENRSPHATGNHWHVVIA